MADRAKKISELTALTGPSADDLLVIVDSPSSNAITKKVTVGTFLNNTAANVTVSNTYYLQANNVLVSRQVSPATSNALPSAVKGTFWFDENYIYVCTANGTVKRSALSTF